MRQIHTTILATLLLAISMINVHGQSAKTSVSYYEGTKTKQTEYEYIVGNSANVKDITIRDDKTGLIKERDLNTYSVEQKVPHGFWKEYHRNGKLKLQLFFVNGVRDGEVKEYHENGQLYRKYVFKQGQIDGEFYEYYENGTLQAKCTYSNYFRKGNTVVYDPEGKPIMYLTYSEPEVRRGRSTLVAGEEAKIAKVLAQTKHPNGQISEEGYLEGYYSQKGFPLYYDDTFFREGVWKEFDEKGVKLSETTFHRNYQDGLTTTFYPNGKKMEEMIYIPSTFGEHTLSIVDGPYKSYFENGQLAKAGTMKTLVTKSKVSDDELETELYNAGDWRRYDNTGKLIEFTSLGKGDELLCEMDAGIINEQSQITDQLDLSKYKALSVDKFTKYLRFHFGELLDKQSIVPTAMNKPLYDEVKKDAMKVFNEYVDLLKSCNEKSCVTTYSMKLNDILQKLDQLRTNENLPAIHLAVKQQGVKAALKI